MHVSPSRIFAKTKYWNFRGNYRMQPGALRSDRKP